ncbi:MULTISPECIES: alpha/beta hydrolase [unclassified Moraxella]|uniref:alpha/beta hydrolase n=1 Tax=unclassified Moraxella TaxID=2685852 RepID=UPI003AF45F80
MLKPHPHILVDAPQGKLEVDALWQNGNPTDPNTQRVALLCHPNPLQEGTMMNKVVSTMYRFARDNGMHVVRFNYRGVGQSTGEYGDVVGEIDDAMTMLHWIHGQTDARQLWLGGFSFGGFVIAKVAQQLAEQGAFLGLDDFELTDLALIAPSIEKNSTADLVLPTDKTFMVYGEHDDVVSPQVMVDFANEFGIRQAMVANTGHFFHGKLGELKEQLQNNTSKLV